ncbi:MAG: glycosyltransferase [Acidobacteriia bacterium]|nr:glycosyltransferase [Terriglobia bacterium]
MRVLHVSAYFAPAFRYGGPPRTILGLCQALVRAGVDVEVFTTTANGDAPLPPAPDGVEYEGVRVRYFPLSWPQRFWRSAALANAIAREAAGADLIHVHGLWNFTVWAGARAARAAGVPYVVSPRGMLLSSARERHAASKAIAWWAVQRGDLRAAALLHATSEDEARGLAGFGPRVVTIANGVDWKTATPEHVARLRRRLDLPADADVIAFIGRLHPIKRLDLLAGAFTRLRRAGRRAWLVIAGPDEGGFRQRVEPLFREVADNVRWAGAIDGDDKWALLAASRALVQCSDSESFGLSVAEALACGVPVVVTDRGAWAGVTAAGCGDVVAHEAAAIGDALERLLARPAAAREMGQRGREWVRRAFAWDAIGRAMAREYESIAGHRPAAAAAR